MNTIDFFIINWTNNLLNGNKIVVNKILVIFLRHANIVSANSFNSNTQLQILYMCSENNLYMHVDMYIGFSAFRSLEFYASGAYTYLVARSHSLCALM